MGYLGSPRDWGLPPKYARFRPGQEEAVWTLADLIGAGKKVITSCSPTGSGKSGQYITLHSLTGSLSTRCVTATKQLQDQLLADFGEMGMADVRGRAAYDCSEVPYDCEVGGWKGCRATLPGSNGSCPYRSALTIAGLSDLAVTNYHLLLLADLPRPDILVLDEAHKLPGILDGFLEVAIPVHEMPRSLKLTLDKQGEELQSYFRDWGKTELRKLAKPGASAGAEEHRRHQRLKRRHETLSGMGDDYIIDLSKDGGTVYLAPLWPKAYGRRLLDPLLGSMGTILTSATVTPKVAEVCGLGGPGHAHYEAAPVFDPRRSPVYFLPVCRVEHRMPDSDFALLVRRADQIIAARPRWKGVIHSVSYRWAQRFYDLSTEKPRLLTHDSRSFRNVVDMFKQTSAPVILLTPSATTGVDFPDDECRFQIQLKVPLKNLSDRPNLNKARKADDAEWMMHDSLQTLVQAIPGRGMRGEKDWCENFLLDAHARWAVFKNKKLVPGWWLQCVENVATIPGPRF